MILPAVLLALAMNAAPPSGGWVRLDGPAPAPKIRNLHLDKEACGLTHKEETLIVGKKGALANVVVTWPKGKSREGESPSTGLRVLSKSRQSRDASKEERGGEGATGTPVTVIQRGCRYEPHVLVLRPGQPLVILNQDPALHTTGFTSKLNRVKTQAQPKGAAPLTVVFSRPEAVRMYCDVHDWMDGWIIVTEDHFQVTGRDGRFSLEGIPAGTKLNFWHESLGEKEATLASGALELAYGPLKKN